MPSRFPRAVFAPVVPFAISVLLMLVVSAGNAAGPKIADPAQVDDDYALQGEYVGMLDTPDGKQKFGAQIVAQGEGVFNVVGYHGGLPGDGWNGEQRVRIDNVKAENGVLQFKDKHGSGVLKDGVITCTLAGSDKPSGKLRRVERTSPTLGAMPPPGAVVLFDGSSADAFKGGRVTDDGLLMEGVTSQRTFGDHSLHIEFRLPYQPQDRGQGRGNSGIYLQGRYEVQMLDSFGLEGKDNECGGIYTVREPNVNMCLPPLVWQTYDIDFTAAKYDDGKLVAPPKATVRHNGVLIHEDVELSPTEGTRAAPVKAGPEPGPVYLQNHGCPVRYRNIWVVEKK
ncbi:MAG: DUF1080 domain-containing protein [Pirellulaceae bacterium]